MTRGNGRKYHGNPRVQLYDYISKNPLTGCWNWTGAFFASGYGQFNNKDIHKTTIAAHRASWIIHNGPIPKGRMVLHDCDNRKCVNPEHLHLGDNKMNMIERSQRGYVHQRKLEESDVREMRQLRQQGWGWMKLAKRYGVRQTSVIQATRGQSWAWIDEPIPTYVGITGRNNDPKPSKYGHGFIVSQDNRDGRFYVARPLQEKKVSLGGFKTLEAAEARVLECIEDVKAGRDHAKPQLDRSRPKPNAELIRNLRSEGLSLDEIGKRTGFSGTTVYHLTKDIEVNAYLRGSTNASSCYTEEQVAKFKELRRSGLSITEAAKQSKIGRSMSYQIDNGHRWRHVT
jgi:hypothetical protein